MGTPDRDTIAEFVEQDSLLGMAPRPPGAGSSVLVIGVAGGSGSGKSTFCDKLQAMLQPLGKCIVLPHDMYYKDEDQVERECGGDWDCPTALHTDQLVRDVKLLKQGRDIERPFYDFNVSRRDKSRSEKITAPKNGQKTVVILEGLMLYHCEDLRKLIDLRIFVDCDEDTRFMRRLSRDTDPVKGRGRSAVSVFKVWANVVKPAHHKYVEPTKRFSHLVVPSHKVHVTPNHLGVNSMSLKGPGSLSPMSKSRSNSDACNFTVVAPMTPGTVPLEAVDLEDQEDLWPTLYLLQAFVAVQLGKAERLNDSMPFFDLGASAVPA